MDGRDLNGRFVIGHNQMYVDYSVGSLWHENTKKNFFKEGNDIRNTGKTRFKKGHVPFMKGRTHSKESREKMRQAQLNRERIKVIIKKEPKIPKILYDKDKIIESYFNKIPIKEIAKENNICVGTIYRTLEREERKPCRCNGENHVNWKGGVTSLNDKLRKSRMWFIFRNEVFTRDKYICQNCKISNKKGVGKTIQLHPHHIKPVALCIKENDIDSVFDLNNGITLCIDCHKKEHFQNDK